MLQPFSRHPPLYGLFRQYKLSHKKITQVLPSMTLVTVSSRGFHMERKLEYIECTIKVFDWLAHEDSNCWVCRERAGRPKKSAKKRGSPKQESSKGIANAALKNAPKSWGASQPLSVARFQQPAATLSLQDMQCILCDCTVDRQVETPCGKLVCAVCISSLMQGADLCVHAVRSATTLPPVVLPSLQMLC